MNLPFDIYLSLTFQTNLLEFFSDALTLPDFLRLTLKRPFFILAFPDYTIPDCHPE